MKLVARIATALALLAFATPALPCGAEKTKATTASSETKKEQPVAKADTAKVEKKAEKKAQPKKATVQVKAPADTKTATAN
jgi:ABC-type transporter MlaC component